MGECVTDMKLVNLRPYMHAVEVAALDLQSALQENAGMLITPSPETDRYTFYLKGLKGDLYKCPMSWAYHGKFQSKSLAKNHLKLKLIVLLSLQGHMYPRSCETLY